MQPPPINDHTHRQLLDTGLLLKAETSKDVNADGQVLRADGSIIPNLYAGGGVAVGVSGKGLEGYLPGNGLLASLGLGMIAAEHAVASLHGN